MASLTPISDNWRIAMTHTTVLTIDMAILVGIFLLGFVAKIFPRRDRNTGPKR
jgi:hypothetical protein